MVDVGGLFQNERFMPKHLLIVDVGIICRCFLHFILRIILNIVFLGDLKKYISDIICISHYNLGLLEDTTSIPKSGLKQKNHRITLHTQVISSHISQLIRFYMILQYFSWRFQFFYHNHLLRGGVNPHHPSGSLGQATARLPALCPSASNAVSPAPILGPFWSATVWLFFYKICWPRCCSVEFSSLILVLL